MPTAYQKTIRFFKENYHSDENELKMGGLVFKELFYSKISNDPKNYRHVVSLLSHHNLISMFSEGQYIISLERIRMVKE